MTDRAKVADNIIPVTPLVVGQVMSEDDIFYTPHKDNPFTTKFPDATAKLVGSMLENWGPLFDLPTPSNPLTPPATPVTPEDSGWVYPVVRQRPTKSQSLPGSPNMARRALERFQFDAVSGHACTAHRTVSAMTSMRRLEEELQLVGEDNLDASFDALSDGGSSNDSALGWDVMMNLQGSRSSGAIPHSSRQNFVRKFSVEASMLNTSLDRYRSRTEQMVKYIETQLSIDPFLRRSFGGPLSFEEDFPSKSYSSSESCLSLDEAAVLSPTSSFSSYSETDNDFLQPRTQFDLMEYRRRSRERFQELVRRWEAKQSNSEPRASTSGSDRRPQHVVESRQLSSSESSDFYLERRFEELRRKWELTQMSSETASSRGTSRRPATIPKSFSSSLLTRTTKKPS